LHLDIYSGHLIFYFIITTILATRLNHEGSRPVIS